jgi:type IV pilus assembly protein PilC
MPYHYQAYMANGEIREGLIDVDTEETAEKILWARELTIVELKKVSRKIELGEWLPTYFGPKSRDVVLFSRQLATLVNSGVSITASFQLLAAQVSNKYLGKVLGLIEEDIRMGTALSASMRKHATIFSNLYCRMIEVGEKTGTLGKSLRQMATYIEKEKAITSKLQGAMAYPIVVLLMAVGVIAIMMNFTLPPMMGLFEEFGADLPWTTLLLLGIVDFFTTYKLHLLVTVIILAVVIAWYITQPAGRKRLHMLLLKIPILGRINTEGIVSKMSRIMSTLLQAGLPLPEVMELTRQTVSNTVVGEALDVVREETIQGRGLSEPFSRIKFFPRMLSYMVRVGEETGTLDDHLETLATFYEDQVDRAMETITRMLEPAMTIFVGLIVGFVAVSIIMPMYQLLGAIK